MLRRKKRMISGLLAMAMVLSWLGGVPAAAAGPETGNVLYRNGFEDPKTIESWTNPGNYTVENDVLRAENAQGALCFTTPAEVTGGDYVVSAKVTVDAIDMEKGSSAGLVLRAAGDKDFLHFRLNASNQDGEDAQLYKSSGGSMAKQTETPFDWEAGRAYTLTASAEEGRILCYVGDALVIDYTDPNYSGETAAAGVGFRIWGCGVSLDDLTVSALPEPDATAPAVELTAPEDGILLPAGTTEVTVSGTTANAVSAALQVNGGEPVALTLDEGGAFTHTLNGLTAGKYTVAVTVTAEDDRTASAERTFRVASEAPEGAYTFEDGSLDDWTGDTGSYSIVDEGGNMALQGQNGSSALLLSPALLEADSYRISSEVKITSSSYTCAGIVFRYTAAADETEGDSYWYFRLQGGGVAALWENDRGSWVSRASTEIGWTAGQQVELAVEADGPYLTCLADGQELFTYVDSGYETPEIPGQAGVRLVNCTALFDNLAVGPVSGPDVTVAVPEETVTAMPMAITGTAGGASEVTIEVKAGEETVRTLTAPVADGAWSCETYLPTGTYTAEVTAVSAGGHGVSQPVTSASFEVALAPATLTAALEQDARVPMSGPVRVVFSAPVDAVTITGVTLAKDGQAVASTAAMDPADPDGRTVLLTPESPMTADSVYEVVVAATVADVMNNTVGEAITLSFRTQKDINALPALENDQGQVELSLNGMWDFAADPQDVGQAQGWYTLENTEGWDSLPVPGNWDLENDYANYKGTGWYGRTFTMPAEYEGYPAYLNLTAVYHDSRIWINGREVGSHDGGYTTFEFRVDSYLNYGGENTIAIQVNNEFSYGAWWKWGGISGDALLRVNNASKIEWQHITSEPNLEDGTAAVTFQYKINNQAAVDKSYTVISEVYDRATGALVGTQTTQVTVHPTAQDDDQRFDSAVLTLSAVKLWHFEDPNLYTVRTRLMDGNTVLHTAEDDIGIRKIEIKDTKFYLNGEQVRLTGANRVWDDRANGQTEPDYVIMRDIDYMKSMGMNCARMSHVPMSENLLDYCDQVGFLLICEGNLWGGSGVAQVTNPAGSEYPYRTCLWYKEMIERDFNHPSIFAWSIGNELSGGQQIVKDYAQYMVNYIKTELDSTRYVTEVSLSAQNPNNPENPMGDSVYYSDFICCNFYGGFRANVQKIHNTYPDKAIFVSEYGNGQTSEIPDKAVINPANILNQWGDLDYVFGASIWTLNDYRSNYSGTPLGQNRVWGVTTVWGDKKIGFETLQKAASPVKSLTVTASGDTASEGGSALLILSVESRDGAAELPSYPIRGAALKWEALDASGNVVDSALVSIPDMEPDGSTWQTAAVLDAIPAGGLGAIRATVIDAQGYEIAETFYYLQAPDQRPEITGVIAGGDSVRVVFEGVHHAQSYTVTLTGGGVSKTATVKMNRYADFTGLTPGATYSVSVSAANSAGEGPASSAVETVTTTDSAVLPPIIWHTEPIEGAFFVGYSVKSASDTYELEYGTQSGNYTQSMTFDTEGSVKVSGLAGGQTYYYRLRSITGGVPSAWSQEAAVTVETADQAREVPVVRGAAGGENSVSLTIDPSWKATGYLVKYGEDAENLDSSVTINRAAVEQLTIDGLYTGRTYWFSVAALNGDVISGYSAPVSAVTAEPGSQDVAVAAVETGELTLSPFRTGGTVTVTASSTFDTEKTLTVTAENLPEGITVPAGQTFAVPAGGSASFNLPVSLTGDVEKGWYTFTVSVRDGETVLASREVELTVCEGTLLLADDFSQTVEGRYTKSGSGGAYEIADGVLKVTTASGSEAPIITAGEADWSGYTIESDVQMVNKDNLSTGVSAGVIFRYQDDKNFCHARLDLGKGATNPSFQVYRWENGSAVNLFSQRVSGAWNDTYNIRVEDTGSLVYFYLDNVLMTILDMGEGGGKAGYRVYAANTQMDDLKVYLLDRPHADKTELQDLVDHCEHYGADGYTEESYEAFQDSLNEALAVLEDEFASQSEVDEALEALEAAEEALEPTSDGTSVPTYRPETETGEHGTVSVSPLFPRQGQTVTITPKPEEGYELKNLTVTDKNGKAVEVTEQADGTWKFTQPAGKVTITAEFAPVEPVTFSDVEAGSWYEAAVNAMVEAGLMQGIGNNMFQPFGTVTRATMWTILARMDGVDTEGGSSWYEKAQAWAVAEGVSDGTNPDAVVTREQIAAMLYRYAGSPAAENALDFADSGDISDWAADAMAWAVAEGILTGTPDGRLNSQGTATRAEAAVMLQRFDGMK
ncbi:glycoside hydrolase family 2 TIM barrel-domain containing protein [Pseudoflavonifractor sp.]|jgi:beta-galactosidase|uniref:glycoside hydrolase family 2 TIM barrel-domain containing protein n=1 Tax=Pseudoflavonifractor sp. TaxID=1980281 RepID=UPI003D8A5FB0